MGHGGGHRERGRMQHAHTYRGATRRPCHPGNGTCKPNHEHDGDCREGDDGAGHGGGGRWGGVGGRERSGRGGRGRRTRYAKSSGLSPPRAASPRLTYISRGSTCTGGHGVRCGTVRRVTWAAGRTGRGPVSTGSITERTSNSNPGSTSAVELLHSVRLERLICSAPAVNATCPKHVCMLLWGHEFRAELRAR